MYVLLVGIIQIRMNLLGHIEWPWLTFKKGAKKNGYWNDYINYWCCTTWR